MGFLDEIMVGKTESTMTRKPRKGDRLVYVGGYLPGITDRYPPGVVVGFRNYGGTVTVDLGNGEYADWPVDQVDLQP